MIVMWNSVKFESFSWELHSRIRAKHNFDRFMRKIKKDMRYGLAS